MMIQAPAKARNGIEMLVERFNLWADDRIADLEFIPTLPDNQPKSLHPRIDTLISAKQNLKRLAKEIIGGNNENKTNL